MYYHEGEKKRDPCFFNHVSYVFFNEKFADGLFSLQYNVEDFIFLHKYRQRKVDCLFSLQCDIKNFIITYNYRIRILDTWE